MGKPQFESTNFFLNPNPDLAFQGLNRNPNPAQNGFNPDSNPNLDSHITELKVIQLSPL